MSKRGADEYITKENGTTPNSASDIAKVKMATAAQLAKRKMAVPKSRANRSGQNPLPGSSSSNPFTSTNMFGASQSGQQPSFQSPGSVMFGASQSFPPADTSNSGFNFSIPNQSSSFTFGDPTPNNPFASMNGTMNSSNASSSDQNDTVMESPQKKPSAGSGLFGSDSGGGKQSSIFSFGQNTNQAASLPAFSFGQPQKLENGTSAPGLNQNNAAPLGQEPQTNIFGQSTQPEFKASSPTVFGQSEGSQQQKPTTSFGFGQTPASTTVTSTPNFAFGQSSTSAPAAQSLFSFGKTTTEPSSSSTPFGNSVSAMPTSDTQNSTSKPTKSSSLFGTASAEPTSISTGFSGFGSPSVSSPTQQLEDSTTNTKQPVSSLFMPPATIPPQPTNANSAPLQEKGKTGPFAGLFGQAPPEQSDNGGTSSKEPAKGLFNFAAPSQPSGLFSTPKPTESSINSAPSVDFSNKPLFSFGGPARSPESSISSSIQSAPGSTTISNPFANLPSSKADTNTPATSKPLFGFSQSTPQKPVPGMEALSSSDKLSSSQPPMNSAQKMNGFAGLGGSSTSDVSANNRKLFGDKDGAGSISKPSTAFGALPTAATSTDMSQEPKGLFALSGAGEPNRSMEAVPLNGQDHKDAAALKHSVNTNPPTRIPPYLSAEDYKAYDSNYRLHSLNREFQKRIASLDPSREDFENIVRNYVAARESIGESIGLYTRNTAGMKRKADDPDDRPDSDAVLAKKNKPDTGSPQKSLFGTGSGTSAIFQSVPSSSARVTGNTPSLVQKEKEIVPGTGGLFGGASFTNKNVSSGSPAVGLFAGPPVPSTIQASSSATPAFVPSFANSTTTPNSAVSTTPTKSPPKKPGFEMPKFAAPVGGNNFMDAFKKSSEASAAKLAKELKAKRKAEEFDSEEDDEDEWDKKYEEEEKARKAKVDAVAPQGFTPIFANGSTVSSKPSFGSVSSADVSAPAVKPVTGTSLGTTQPSKSSNQPINISDNETGAEDDDEDESSGHSHDVGEEDGDEGDEEDAADTDDLPEDAVDDEDDNDEDDNLETALVKSKTAGRSLFDRVTSNPVTQKSSITAQSALPSIEQDKNGKQNPLGSLFGKSVTNASLSPAFTSSATKEPYVPSKTFNFTPTPPVVSPNPVLGASIFAGGSIRDGPIAGEGLFGSRPSTPSNADKPSTNIFAGFAATTPGSFGLDHTWKKGSEIKFGTSTNEAPSVNITEPSPRKEETKPFASLFGANPTTNGSSSATGVGFGFGQTPAPGFLAATSHLTGGPGTNSGFSSRATSPGTTDNESVATNEEDYANDAQVSLMETRPGEEHERVLFESKARALRFYKEEETKGTKLEKGWNAVGLGIVRLLKHKETGKARLVMRAEPGANIILNTNLHQAVKYEAYPSGSAGMVKFTVFTQEGGQMWGLKIKTLQTAQTFAKLLEENKTPSKQ